jgi:hypothetical protein
VDVPCIKELKESNREDYDIFSKLLNKSSPITGLDRP